MKSSTCKSCGARIIWADHGDRRIPLNATRVRTYSLMDHPSGIPVAHVHAENTESAPPQLSYISHFVSCPDASRHSRGGAS